MGLLDKKERILDVSLTDRGRQLLSQNLLDFEFYAFSDEGVDYAAALTASLLESGSADFAIRNSLSFEAVQRKNSNEPTDLASFLYTVPSRQQTLPVFVTNFDSTPDITAKRRFYIDRLTVTSEKFNAIQQPIAVIMRSTVNKENKETKMVSYVAQQKFNQTKAKIFAKKNVVGLNVAANYIMVNNDSALNIENGTMVNVESIAPPADQLTSLSLQQEIEVVSGLDRVKINFTLKSNEGAVAAPGGYLVEVYESGSDGTLTRLFEENVYDVLEDEVLKKGFEEDLFFDGDVESTELIAESQRLKNKQLRKRELELIRLQKDLRKKLRKIRTEG
jgi:hypothetical protein